MGASDVNRGAGLTLTLWASILHKHFRVNRTITRKGDAGDVAHMIQRGSIEITCQVADQRRVIASPAADKIFGEMALIYDKLRIPTTLLAHIRVAVVWSGRAPNWLGLKFRSLFSRARKRLLEDRSRMTSVRRPVVGHTRHESRRGLCHFGR